MYLNPTYPEVLDILASNPDSVRIVVAESGDIGVANSYGYTHTCIRRKLRISGAELILEKSGVLWEVGVDDSQVSPTEFGDRLVEFCSDFLVGA